MTARLPLTIAAISLSAAGFLLANAPAVRPPGASTGSAGPSTTASPAQGDGVARGGRAGRGNGGLGGGGGGRGQMSWPQGPEPRVHDPVMIKEGDYYYVFYTGGLINALRSKDLKSWDRVLQKDGDREVSTVFTQANAPVWSTEIQGQGGRGRGRGAPGAAGPAATAPGAVPSTQGQAAVANGTPPGRAGVAVTGTAGAFGRRDYWAPDISIHDGQYFLYYCASSFGSNRSGIGLATNKSLDPASPDFKWTDQGKIIKSELTDFYNCIDPNAFFDSDGKAYLTFGSFYWNQGGGRGGPENRSAATSGGIMIVPIDPATGKVPAGAAPKTVASRAFPERAIEAPFLIKANNHYYLFVSWDRCCAGLNSTYRIMVGRADTPTGPFLDKDGKDMTLGGGTQVLAGDGDRVIGPGHQGLAEDILPNGARRWLLLYHFYDGHQNGVSKLHVRPVSFDSGWPVLGDVLNKAATPVGP